MTTPAPKPPVARLSWRGKLGATTTIAMMVLYLGVLFVYEPLASVELAADETYEWDGNSPLFLTARHDSSRYNVEFTTCSVYAINDYPDNEFVTFSHSGRLPEGITFHTDIVDSYPASVSCSDRVGVSSGFGAWVRGDLLQGITVVVCPALVGLVLFTLGRHLWRTIRRRDRRATGQS